MTHTATKIALVGTLVLTTAALAAVEVARRDGPLLAGEIAPIFWLLTILFALRIAGQIVVALRSPRWLPPMSDWNLVPYRVLLPAQLVILAVMVWIDASFSSDAGLPTERARALGWPVIAFSAVYAAAMAVRYVVRMRRSRAERWFGGTIPIVFHLVLATYLFTLGSFNAGR